jgi:hypothetical protein
MILRRVTAKTDLKTADRHHSSACATGTKHLPPWGRLRRAGGSRVQRLALWHARASERAIIRAVRDVEGYAITVL